MVSAESSSVDLGPLPTPEIPLKDEKKKDSDKAVVNTLTEVESAVLCD